MNKKSVELKILGILSTDLIPIYRNALGCNNLTDSEILLFCDFSESDISIGFNFNYIADSSGLILFEGKIILTKVSQEFFISYDLISKGHKTICKFEFFGGNVPEVLNVLPIIKDWYESDRNLILK